MKTFWDVSKHMVVCLVGWGVRVWVCVHVHGCVCVCAHACVCLAHCMGSVSDKGPQQVDGKALGGIHTATPVRRLSPQGLTGGRQSRCALGHRCQWRFGRAQRLPLRPARSLPRRWGRDFTEIVHVLDGEFGRLSGCRRENVRTAALQLHMATLDARKGSNSLRSAFLGHLTPMATAHCGGGGGVGMTPWCVDLVCSWRPLLADRHSLPFPRTLSLHRRWGPSASHHPVTFLFLPALTVPLPCPFLSLGLSLCRPRCPSGGVGGGCRKCCQ